MAQTMKVPRILAALVALCALSLGGVTADDPPEKPKPTDDAFFILFKTAGRKWSLKRVPKPGNEGGDVDTSYHYFEVFGVHDEYAELGTCTLTSPTADPYDDLGIGRVKFNKEESTFKPGKGFTKAGTEKIKCEAGTFECTRWQDATGATQWRSTAFPGLLVKWDDRFGTRELHQFDTFEGDPGYKGPKPKRKPRPEKADDDPARLFKKKGRIWVMKVGNYSGEINKRRKSFELQQYEVAKLTDQEAVVEVRRMTLLKELIRGVEPTRTTMTLADAEDFGKPSPRAVADHTEPRRLLDRIVTCTVYKYKDDEKRDVTDWYANEWPGLLVRRQIKAEPLNRMVQFMEIIEFNE